MIQIEVAGVIVPEDEVVGEEGITINLLFEDADGDTVIKRITGEMEFFGEAWQTLKTELVDNPAGKLSEVPLKIYDDCGSDGRVEVFSGVIPGSMVGWCEGDCSIKCQGVEKTQRTAAHDCMLSTLIYDDRNGFLTREHPRVVYCDELRPDWLQHMQLILALMTMIAINSFTPIVMIFASLINSINLIITVLNALSGGNIGLIDFDGNPNNGNPDLLSDWYDSLEDMRNAALGCGRRHPTPAVRDYIQNVCDVCGITFQSSILNEPSSDYFNLLYFSAPAKRGIREEDAETFIRENRPIRTGAQLMDDMRKVFNGKSRIVSTAGGPVLHFERRDQIPGNTHWLNVEDLRAAGQLVGEVCYEWSKEDPASSFYIHYIPDGVDVVGNEAIETYTEIIEWNGPVPNASQRGVKEHVIPFGIPRFRRDGVTDDIRDNYRWLPGIVGDIEKFSDVMLMEMGICGVPKLIVWDGISRAFAVCKKYEIPGYEIEGGKNYNYPMQLHEFQTLPNTIYPTTATFQSIYTRFWTIDNPRVQDNRWQDFTFTFEKFTKAQLQNLPEYPTVGIGAYEGTVREIAINLTQRTIFVAGSY